MEIPELIESSFHHYLPQSKPQQRFKFISGTETHELLAEKGVCAGRTLEKKSDFAESKKKTGKYLTIDVEKMLKDLDLEEQSKEGAELESIQNKYRQEIEFKGTNEMVDVEHPATKDEITQLWTEKYKSTKFFELLTPEEINRNVLTWLKSWDEIVFPNNSKVNLRMPESILSNPMYKRDLTFRKVDAEGNTFWATADQVFTHHNKKVIALYGPPGTGKSTMARVLAKQCGYEPREINASDLRSANDLIGEMKNALTSNSHFTEGGQSKPVCLIVDEVDGAVSGGVGAGFGKVAEFLKKSIHQTKHMEKDLDDDAESDQKTKKKKESVVEMKRPIIFICNDLHAKAIRPLRELALTVKVEESDEKRLHQRMRQICKQEKVKIEDQILSNLTNQCNFDARCSINALQFLASKFAGQKITQNDIQDSSIFNGQVKDEFTNIFTVTQDILLGKLEEKSSRTVFRDVKKSTSALGDYRLLNDSLFENYSNCCHFFDDNLEKTAYFTDLLSIADTHVAFSFKAQQHGFVYQFGHLPSVMFKRYCAHEQRHIDSRPVRVMFPSVFRNIRADSKQNTSVFDSLLDFKRNDETGERFNLSSSSPIQSLIRKADMMRDVLPWVYHMLHPDVREINIQLFNSVEKEVFLKAIELLVLFDIKINVNDGSAQGPSFRLPTKEENTSFNDKSYVPHFQPDIAKVVNFGKLSTNLSGGQNRMFMRLKTQILIMQNYEKVKQAMLAGTDPAESIFQSKLLDPKNVRKSTQGIGSFLTQKDDNLQTKKRTIDEVSAGRFRFKFKDGQSKNFKRELDFDWFLTQN